MLIKHKKVSQRTLHRKTFYVLEIWIFETQQLHIVYFYGVIDTSLQLALRQAQRPNNS